MSKILNIGVLDVRGVQEEVAKKITEMANIGVLIEDSRSQVLLKDAKRVNVGSTLKLSPNEDVDLITHNGKTKIDREYLEGIINKVVILFNGKLIFQKDVDVKLLREKLFSIILNGKLICPKRLSGLIQSKGTINGALISYSSDYIFFEGKVKLTNRFLKGLKRDSKISFEKLLILEEIDFKLLEEKVSNIEVLDKLIILEEYENEMAQYIDDFYSVETVVIPKSELEVKYIDDDTIIDDSFVKRYNGNLLYVDGEVEITISKDVDFGDYIKLLICEKIICNKNTYERIKDNIGKDVKLDLIQGKVLKNTGKLVLSGKVEEEISIRNMGKLILEENLDYDSFIKNVVFIENFGKIEVPEDKMSLVEEKVKKNSGVIKSNEEIEKNKIEKEEEKEDILYANVAELKL